TGLVIDAQSAADVQVFDIEPALPQRCINASDFLYGLLEVLNVQDLAAQMKVQQLESVGDALGGEFIDDRDEFGYRDAKLRSIASRGGPFSRSRHRHSNSNPEFRPNPEFAGQRQH